MDNEILKFKLKQIFEDPVIAITTTVIVAVSSHIYYILLNLFDKIYGYGKLKYSETINESIDLEKSQKIVGEMENNKK